jgi:hypothetical protein
LVSLEIARICYVCVLICPHPPVTGHWPWTQKYIATNLICDALDDKFDTALLITADSDLVPAIEAVKKLKPQKRITVLFLPVDIQKNWKILATQ